MPVEEGDVHIRVRVKDPGRFQSGSFRTVTLSASQGIKAVMGRLKGSTSMTTQAYLFVKAKGWTKDKAEAWAKEHKPKS
jgi:hypothetical protein